MEVIKGVERWKDRAPLFVALGNFDGVHAGHRRILARAVERAAEAGVKSAALVFNPHPLKVLRPGQPLYLLTDMADRAGLMASLGLDYLIVEPFNLEMASLSPEQFVKNILMEKLKVKGVVVGCDYSFGRGGQGKAENMRALGEELGFAVEICPLVLVEGIVVSSSAIRQFLLRGDVRRAAKLLQHPFFRRGKVVRGRGIGNRLIYPTANIGVSPDLLWPGYGVYLTAVGGLEGGCLFGVTNVGPQPTLQREEPSVETHILDYRGELYDREICLYFLEKLREIKAFPSTEHLREQIGRDIAQARKLIEGRYAGFRGEAGFPLPGAAAGADRN
ncbi:MAG TPA: bifunctional riboflavin kinase/FAD synthetase [Bacillota bacterium]|nr:bifunctional riboflavin kinase/FAD synthetase [Bacillota bacterium]HPT33559.1 bifunctional riboflavin kinase/FAD synthetase [Bacillota bacterium]